jgi:hypothetical protein
MPGDDLTIDEVYAEIEKRTKAALDAAIAALKAELMAELDRRVPQKKPFSIKRPAS